MLMIYRAGRLLAALCAAAVLQACAGFGFAAPIPHGLGARALSRSCVWRNRPNQRTQHQYTASPARLGGRRQAEGDCGGVCGAARMHAVWDEGCSIGSPALATLARRSDHPEIHLDACAQDGCPATRCAARSTAGGQRRERAAGAEHVPED
jgi:hypothetical protein